MRIIKFCFFDLGSSGTGGTHAGLPSPWLGLHCPRLDETVLPLDFTPCSRLRRNDYMLAGRRRFRFFVPFFRR